MTRLVRDSGPRLGRGVLNVMLILAAPVLAASAARAGEDAPHAGFWDGLLETFDIKTKVGPTPDFVQATHPDSDTLKYIPTGQTHPKRSIAVATPSEIEATKQALDAAREAQLKPKPAAAKPPAAKPKTTKPKNDAAAAN